MGRYRGPRLKIIKRLGTALPGLMCAEQKSTTNQYSTGQHNSNKRGKVSEYKLHLQEKQKLRFHYGVQEKQLCNYSKIAFKSKENTGLLLLNILEKRIDNIIFRAGFFRTIRAARQAISHGHITINNKKINIPSYSVQLKDSIQFNVKSPWKKQIEAIKKSAHNIPCPTYIDIDGKTKTIKINNNFTKKDIPININEQLVVEYYSGR